MTLTFQDLADKLPSGSIEFVGNNQLKLNFSQLTGDTLTLDSSCIESIIKLMQELSKVTDDINTARLKENPPKPPIMFASRDLVGTADAPEFEFIVRAKIDVNAFSDNLIDPTND